MNTERPDDYEESAAHAQCPRQCGPDCNDAVCCTFGDDVATPIGILGCRRTVDQVLSSSYFLVACAEGPVAQANILKYLLFDAGSRTCPLAATDAHEVV